MISAGRLFFAAYTGKAADDNLRIDTATADSLSVVNRAFAEPGTQRLFGTAGPVIHAPCGDFSER
jgi:hypothetical protein